MSAAKQDRHSNMAVDGKPKKGGAGKGGWGKGGEDDLKELHEDQHDPNYDSDKEKDETLDVATDGPNAKMNAIIKDFLLSGDEKEAVSAVSEAHFGNHSTFIRKSIVAAMERQPFERELVSQLLASLRVSVIPEDQYDEALQSSLNRLPQTLIDIPQAVEFLGKFLARAVLDEVVSPSFLRTCNLAHIQAEESVTLANSLTNQKHRIHRLLHIWGPGDLASVKRLKEEIDSILKEFIETNDHQEAQRSLVGLSVRHFHFQFVKRSVRAAISSDNNDINRKLFSLLEFLHDNDVIGVGQMSRGILLVEEEIEDIKLDSPKSADKYKEFKEKAEKKGWLYEQSEEKN